MSGLAVSNRQTIGDDQSWQDKTASRQFSINYTNTTGKSIEVSVFVTSSAAGSLALTGVADGETVAAQTIYCSASGYRASLSFIVPNGAVYSFLVGGSANYSTYKWMELAK